MRIRPLLTQPLLTHPLLTQAQAAVVRDASPPDDGNPGGPKLPGSDPDGFDVLEDIYLGWFSWYLPTFRIVAPTAQSQWPQSPFGYTFVTGHAADGEPSLAATITVQLQSFLSDATKAKISDLGHCAPIPLDGFQAVIDIPYVDEVKGSLTTTSIAASRTTQDGDNRTLVFEVAGDLARAAYGSLSRPGYQPVPLRLRTSVTFTAYWWDWLLPPRGTSAELVAADGVRLAPERAPAVSDGGDDPVGSWDRVSTGQSRSLDLLVPCTDYGRLYLDTTDPAKPVPIGCQDGMALGRLPDKLYTALDELATADYEVLASLTRPAVYLVLPRRYRVGRADPGHPGVPDWSPLIRWIEVFDATHDGGLPCRLQASLQPDLRPAQLADLSAVLAVRAGRRPTLLLPTDYGSGMSALTVTGWNASTPVQATVSGSSLQISAELNYTDAVVVNAMLGSAAAEGQLVGNAAFALSDGSSIGPVELHVDVVHLTGPWPAGPVLASGDGATATVQNHAETAATLSRLLETLADGSSRLVAGGLAVAVPGGGGTATVPAATSTGAQLTADYTLADSTPAVIDQQRLYIEDLHTTITLVNDAKMGADGITGVDVRARLDGDTQSLTFALAPDTPMFQIDLVQPLVADRQADSGLLHLGATVHRAGQPDTSTGDFTADLHQGVILRLSSVLATPP
ncbi:hypothetical protein ABUW04_18545 [Streptacidiphilus sp. N1-10]|uniref:Secreted protein n=1 Tax=Streptacidiphilus jeojiensis TaxID=3229225 RepID=A0ABV6XPS8_9ACTN